MRVFQGPVLAGLCKGSDEGLLPCHPAPAPSHTRALWSENHGVGLPRSPRQACSWLVSTLRISLTHAALISGVGAWAQKKCQESASRALMSCALGDSLPDSPLPREPGMVGSPVAVALLGGSMGLPRP